ncbi:hypothetical protein LJC68_05580 [Bacteroidales bacterium OttesenSCG-928-B11]|nr:hypothetical protein [Bacteroidales bacterium OttesenSCG-928-C03]MDL2312328.1 hypothetical protein [Bacteroidales bacterium OttesenSCG-928-B11]
MKMSKIQKAIIGLGIIILFSGCVYEAPEKTTNGRNVYNSWNSAMSTLINNYFDIPFLFNAWLETPEELRDNIEDALFPYYKIRQLGENEWGLYNATELLYHITKNNLTLSEPGAEWTVTYYYNYLDEYNYYSQWAELTSFITSPVVLKISCPQANEWKLIMTENESSISNVDLTLKSLQESLSLGLKRSLFSIHGTGLLMFTTYDDANNDLRYYVHDENGYISFETNEMVFSHFGSYYDGVYNHNYNDYVPFWSDGLLQLKAANDKGDKTETELSFFKSSTGQYYADITYRGVTEEWLFRKE